ncbi:hypothetical protein MKW98_006506 [Papaver atlanticum]|uniref:Uncharacterized protein n=1 Tax=Papaver atlanticum TaxID=357466 RepID=A0AAD4XTS2_9MAGN|nr:hypothetical protein MKW98_006506 [Papaver atlanticum]
MDVTSYVICRIVVTLELRLVSDSSNTGCNHFCCKGKQKAIQKCLRNSKKTLIISIKHAIKPQMMEYFMNNED